MEVLNLLNTNPELLNGLVYGPEGKNWEKLKAKKTVSKSLMATKETLTCQDGTLVTTGSFTSTKTLQMNKLHNLKKDLETAKESPALGFIFNTDNVKSEISAITNTMQQFDTAINTGTVDPEKAIPELMENLNLKVLTKKYWMKCKNNTTNS